MHNSVIVFVKSICTPDRLKGRRVLEVGSYNVNGSVRDHLGFLAAEYHGIDITPQPGYVDEVMDATELLSTPADSWDVVISTEMMEHAKDWQQAIAAMRHVVRPGGLVVITCRGPGFPFHEHPGDYWRFRPIDFASMFQDYRIIHLGDDWQANHPGVLFAGYAPGGDFVMPPASPERVKIPWHTAEAARVRAADRAENPVVPERLGVFYHVCCMGNWKEIVAEQLALMDDAGLDPFIHILGTRDDEAWFRGQGRDVADRNGSFLNYETPTLQSAWEWACENPGAAVLYCHTKGVSKPGDPGRIAWRQLMGDQVIRGWRRNLKSLATVDMVGVSYQSAKGFGLFPGNFWMARADWMASLPSPENFRNGGGPDLFDEPWQRMHAEVWLGSSPHHTNVSLMGGGHELWRMPHVADLLARSLVESDCRERLEQWVAGQEAAGLKVSRYTRDQAEGDPRMNGDVIVLDGVLELCCNAVAGTILGFAEKGEWKRLLVSTHPGADNRARRGLPMNGTPRPFDVEDAGILTLSPSGFLPRAEGSYLIYERD